MIIKIFSFNQAWFQSTKYNAKLFLRHKKRSCGYEINENGVLKSKSVFSSEKDANESYKRVIK